MKNTDYIDLSNSVQPFEGLIPSFGKNMGEGYMTGKRPGATDYIEVIDCEAVKDYIAENVETPEHEGQFASFEGFISETALKEEEENLKKRNQKRKKPKNLKKRNQKRKKPKNLKKKNQKNKLDSE